MATDTLGLDDSQRLERMQALAGIGLWEWRVGTDAMYWSPQLRRLFGFGQDETLDFTTLRSLVFAEELAAFDQAVADAVTSQQQFRTIQRMYRADHQTVRVLQIAGEVVRDDSGAVVSMFGTGADITEQQTVSNELAHLATHDTLTGLHNRRGIMALVDERLVQHADEPTALLLIDIDHFKDINDLRGHAVGDQVMRALAQHLEDHLPAGAALGRLGGDEFAVVLAAHDGAAARAVAEHLCDAVNASPMMTSTGALRLTVSVGVAAMTAPTDTETVLANADLALYEAKNAGRNCSREFLPEQHLRARQRLSVQQRLAEALDADGLTLMAQPIVDLATDEISAWELLLRLRDGHMPELPPTEFLPTAERSSLATRVDRWVVAHAIAALSTPAARRRNLCLQVNVTSRSLEDPTFGDAVLDALSDAGVHPYRLGLEVTETATMGNVDAVRTLVRRLGSAGCPIVLDDFGTGFGSLVSLRNVPFTAIKVAGAFVQRADRPAPNLTVIDGMVRLAHGLGMQVVAEEVDRKDLLLALRDAGVRGAQGYLLGEPRPLDDVLAGLA
ncbi:MAG TPA: EAL domain-containing protein [Euzebyales bacterium]|nr:EAL domain-containing protein [Euzebyales bacterium]